MGGFAEFGVYLGNRTERKGKCIWKCPDPTQGPQDSRVAGVIVKFLCQLD